MTLARFRKVEAPTGIGTVTGPNIDGLRAHYFLEIRQKIHIAGDEEVPGLYNLIGSIELLKGDAFVLMNEGNLVLTLSDGRQMGFFVKSANFGDPRCEIALTDKMSLLDGLEAD